MGRVGARDALVTSFRSGLAERQIFFEIGQEIGDIGTGQFCSGGRFRDCLSAYGHSHMYDLQTLWHVVEMLYKLFPAGQIAGGGVVVGSGEQLGQGRYSPVVMASGRPLSPSQTTMHTSPVPRFLISVRTASRNFAPSPPSPAYSPMMSRCPSTVTPIAT